MANNFNFRVGKIIRTEAELDAFLGAVTRPEFTDEHGNPVQVENHPKREKRTDYMPQERPQRPARKEK